MRYLLLFCALAVAGLRALPSASQALDATFAAPASLLGTADVVAMGPVQADAKRLVSGYFTRVNGQAVTSGVVRLDASGALDQPFLQNVGSAYTPYRIRGLANGQYLLGEQGGSLTAGGLTRTEVLRLNADGAGDAAFDPGTGPTSTNGYGYSNDFVAQPDGKVLVGGYFDTFSGWPANGVVRLNANGTVDNGFSVGAGLSISSTTYDEVYALAVQADGKVLVGGDFTTFNGQPANGLVRLNANGSLDTSFNSALNGNAYVYALAVQPDGNILVSGALTVNGVYGSTLTRLLPSGSFDPSFTLSPAIGSRVYTTYTEAPMVVQPDGKIVVVGSFDLPGYRRVARLNADGSLDITFQTPDGPNDVPASVGVQPNGSILLGGNFTGVGTTETSLARLASGGALDAGFAPKLQLVASVTALVRQPDGTLLAGGSFTEWDGQPVHRLVRLSANGALDASYVASSQPLKGTVSSLLLQADGKALVGTFKGLYRVLASGAPDPSFTFFYPNVTNITALAQQTDGKLVVAGGFTGTSGGVSYQRLARLNDNGSFDNTFARAATPQGTPLTPTALLVQADGRIVVASPVLIGSTSNTTYLQRYEPGGALDASFSTPSFTYTSAGNTGVARVVALAQQADGKLLVGGRFTTAAGATQNSLIRLTTTGAPDASFAGGTQLTAGGIVNALAVQPNGRVLVGGNFQAASAAGTYNNLTRVLTNGQLDATFAPAGARPNGTVSRLIVQPDGGILLQGSFTSIGTQARLNLARLTAPNVLAVAAPAAVAAATALWPVPAHEVLRVLPAPTAHPLGAELLDALGRVVRQQALAGPGEFSFDTSTLPAGLYVLRLRYHEGTVARQLAVE